MLGTGACEEYGWQFLWLFLPAHCEGHHLGGPFPQSVGPPRRWADGLQRLEMQVLALRSQPVQDGEAPEDVQVILLYRFPAA